jgi:hypothetical protein
MSLDHRLVNSDSVLNLGISPAPTDEEAAAIVAAIEFAWPRPVVLMLDQQLPEPAGAWRWSGRWWASSPLGSAR